VVEFCLYPIITQNRRPHTNHQDQRRDGEGFRETQKYHKNKYKNAFLPFPLPWYVKTTQSKGIIKRVEDEICCLLFIAIIKGGQPRWEKWSLLVMW